MANWKKSLAALWFANFITATGMLAMVPFLTFFVEDLGVTDPAERNLWTGLLFGAAPIAAALMGPIWGGIGDRFGRKTMVLRAILAIVVFVGAMTFAQNVWQMLALRILQGLFSGYAPPSITLISLQAPPERGAFVAGLMQAAMPAGAILGYNLGGWIEETGEMRDVFPICSVLAFVGFLIVAIVVKETDRPSGAPKGIGAIWEGIVSDLRYTLRLPALVQLLAMIVAVRFLVSTIEPSYARYVETFGANAVQAGLLLSVDAAMLLVFMPFWARLMESRSGPRRVFALCAFGLSLSVVAQAVSVSYGMLFVSRMVQGLFLAGIMPAGYGMAVKSSDREHRGSAIGMCFLALALSHAIGSSVGGSILNLLGFRAHLWSIAGCAASVALLAWWISYRDRLREAI